jgi:hypothetical protein
MAGLKREARLRADDPAIHVWARKKKDVDARVKPGHDGAEVMGELMTQPCAVA